MAYALSANQSPQPANRSRFFAVSLLKLFVMSLCSFGLYQFYWLYKNWLCVTRYNQSKLGWWLTASVRAAFWIMIFGSLATNSDLRLVSNGLFNGLAHIIKIAYIGLIYPLFNEIRKEALRHNFTKPFQAVQLAFIWTALMIADYFLPFRFFVFSSCLTVIPPLVVQKYVNELNSAIAPDSEKNNKFSIANWLLIAFFACIVWSMSTKHR